MVVGLGAGEVCDALGGADCCHRAESTDGNLCRRRTDAVLHLNSRTSLSLPFQHKPASSYALTLLLHVSRLAADPARLPVRPEREPALVPVLRRQRADREGHPHSPQDRRHQGGRDGNRQYNFGSWRSASGVWRRRMMGVGCAADLVVDACWCAVRDWNDQGGLPRTVVDVLELGLRCGVNRKEWEGALEHAGKVRQNEGRAHGGRRSEASLSLTAAAIPQKQSKAVLGAPASRGT